MKYLKVDFFKRQKFPTKMDGVDFIKCNSDLVKKMNKVEKQIEDFTENKVNEFEEFFEKYSEEKTEYLKGLKEKIKDRKTLKEEKKKEDMKEDMKKEIMMEMEMEKNREYIPEKDINYSIKDLFIMVVKNKSKKELVQIKKLKNEADNAIKILEKVRKELEKMENI